MEFHKVNNALREFFLDRGYIEIPAQSEQMILAACEDPETVTRYFFNGESWPLPQTGQLHLEVALLKNPTWPGVFCQTTSYRDEINPIPGRHDKIFPMFEFEAPGDMRDLIQLEEDLISHLGFKSRNEVLDYGFLASEYTSDGILKGEDEEEMAKNYGSVISIVDFPKTSHPFWNMKKHPDRATYRKVDVILHGMETIGSAERSCSSRQMEDDFFSVSDGKYAEILFTKFGRDRVLKELYEYLSMDFFKRFGAGVGMTRLIRAMKLEGLL